MQAKRTENFLVIRLEPGDEVFPSLQNALSIHGIGQGFVIAGIGHFTQVRLGYFVGEGKYKEEDFPEGGELLNLSGNVALKDGRPFLHLHAIIGRDDYSVFGGHLVSAVVNVTCEVLILAVPEFVRMTRKLEGTTKLFGLYVE